MPLDDVAAKCIELDFEQKEGGDDVIESLFYPPLPVMIMGRDGVQRVR